MPDVKETEDQLVERARLALSRCNWEIGECAAAWTRRFARGRTDADFGALIGLSGDQVYQRRRVWETFSDVADRYDRLKWSHFYAALNWDDAAECLQWANDMAATVAEMRAWRRAQHGEDLSAPAEVEGAEGPYGLELVPVAAAEVREAPQAGRRSGEPRPSADNGASEVETVAGAPRLSDAADDYAPFGRAARGSPTDATERPAPSAELTLKRIVTSLERCNAALTPDVLEACASASPALRARLKAALDSLTAKTHVVLQRD